MKNRFFLTGILLLVSSSFGFAWWRFNSGYPSTSQTFHATITRDCAPWDGAAFTVKINLPHGKILDISIWQSPPIAFPTTYTFPDSTAQIGNTNLIFASGNAEPLSGTAFFSSIDEAHPVNGHFKFRMPDGTQIAGIFNAEWDYQLVLCG